MADNPVQTFVGLRNQASAKRANEDLTLWHAWNKGGQSASLLQPLLQRYDTLLNRRVQEWRAPAVAPAAFKAELQRHFIEAAETYDPDRGVAFNTHVQYRIQKAKRYNAKYQNIGYIPEGQAEHIGAIQSAQSELNEALDRAPTAAEIADHVGLPAAKVRTVLKALRSDIPSSKFETDPFEASTAREGDVIRLMKRRPDEYLTPDEATVFQHVFAVNGYKKITDTTTLASTLGVSLPKISRLKTSIAAKIKKNI